MDYKKVFAGLTVGQFNDIVENWYARLNSLKDYYVDNPESQKSKILIQEMIERMIVVSELYLKVNQPPPPKHIFKRSGVVVESNQPIEFIKKGEAIIPIVNL